jgi:hypothetical protein
MRGGFASFSELLAQPWQCPRRFQSDSGLCPKVRNSPDGVHVWNSLFPSFANAGGVPSGDEAWDQLAVDVGEAEVPALVAEGELLVVEA